MDETILTVVSLSGAFSMVQISIAGGAVQENDGFSDEFIPFTITLSEALASDVSVEFSTRSGTALSGLDFDQDDGTFRIPAGDTTGTLFIRTEAENIVEADESVFVDFFNASGADFVTGEERVTSLGVILDNDTAGERRALFLNDVDIREGDAGTKDAVFDLRLSRPASEAVTIEFETRDGSALAGEDYTAETGSVTFAAGQTSAQVAVAVIGDAAVEGDETFSLIARPAADSASLLAVPFAGGKATVRDDDSSSQVPVLGVNSAPILENDGFSDEFVAYTVTLTEPAATNVSVDFQTRSGRPISAFSGADFDRTSDTLTFAPGQTTAQIFVRTESETVAESDEGLIVDFFNVTGAAFANGQERFSVPGIILNDDTTGLSRTVSISDPDIREGDADTGQAVFTLRLSRPSSERITLTFETRDGSAIAGQDYVARAGSVTFEPGQTEAAVFVDVTGDLLTEGDEFFTLVAAPDMTSADQLAFGFAAGLATIRDTDASDTLPSLFVTADRVLENDGFSDAFLRYTVTLSEPAATNVTVGYQTISGTALSGLDFDQDDRTVTIPVGETTANVFVRTESETTVEGDESVLVEFQDVSGAVFAHGEDRLTVLGTILDEDTAGLRRTVQISNTDLVEGDAGTKTALFTVRLSTPSSEAITIAYETRDADAAAGTDYVAKAGTITFAPGQTEAAIAVDVLGDGTVEGDESFSVVAAPEPNSADLLAVDFAAGVGTILDNDASANEPSLGIRGGSVLENDGFSDEFIRYTLTLSEAAATDVLVDYRTRSGTALEGADYDDAVGTVRIRAGETTADFFVRTEADSVVEPDESVFVDFFNVSGAVLADGQMRQSVLGVILDNDSNAVSRAVFVGDVEVREGDAGEATAVFDLRLSRPSTEAITLNYQTRDGTARSGQDYAGGTGTVTFAPGQTLAAVDVAVFGDSLVEDAETFSLVVEPDAASASQLALASAGGVATIRDDDVSVSVPSLSISSAPILENDGFSDNFLIYTLALSEPASTNVSLSFLARTQTAVEGADFDSLPDTLTFTAGQTTALLSVRTESETLVEADETLFVDFFNLSGAAFANGEERVSVAGTILDEDSTGVRRAVSIGAPRLNEGDTGEKRAVFELKLSRPATEVVEFNYTSVQRGADGSDFAGLSSAETGTIAFVPGQTIASVEVPVSGDTTPENLEDFGLVLTTVSPSIEGGRSGAAGEGLIFPDDAGFDITPEISVYGNRALENDGFSDEFVAFTVALSRPAATQVTVDFATQSGTAESGSDFDASSGTLTLDPGQTTGQIFVRTAAESVPEDDETVLLTLSNPVNAVFAGGATTLQAEGLILDDDTLPVPASAPRLVVNDITVEEGDAAVFTLTRIGAAAEAASGSFAVLPGTADAGSDYTVLAPGTFTFGPGEQTTTVTIQTSDDLEVETTETLVLELTDLNSLSLFGRAETAYAIAFIGDNDEAPAPTVSIMADPSADQEEGNSGTRDFTFTVTRDGDLSAASSVRFAVTGPVDAADFGGTLPGGVVDFAPDEASQILSLAVSGDTDVEDDETFTVTLSDPVNAVLDRAAASGVIRNDDTQAPDPAPMPDPMPQPDPSGATEFADVLIGGNKSDVIDGLGGDDVIIGLGDDDTLIGNRGDDVLSGGTGDDDLTGDGGSGAGPSGTTEVTTSATGQIPSTGQTVSVSLTLPDASSDQSISGSGFVSLGSVVSNTFNVVYVIDVSGSTGSVFLGDVDVGDVNGDGLSNRILDGEINSFIQLNTSIVDDLGLADTPVSIVAFNGAAQVVLDAVPAGQDSDGDGERDVVEALRTLRDGGSTDFDAALQTTIDVLNDAGPGNNRVFFVSDGANNGGAGSFADEVVTLTDPEGLNAQIRAIGVGQGANLEQLDLLDDGLANTSAERVLDPNALTAQLTGGTIDPADVDRVEVLLNDQVVETIGQDGLSESPFGLRYGATLTGLDPTAEDRIEARVIFSDPDMTSLTTGQTVELAPQGGGSSGAGADVLEGGPGDDRLTGLGGNDRLVGGFDDDTLIGGEGSDLYAFAKGDGDDLLIDTGGPDDTDVLAFLERGIRPEETVFNRDGLDLVIGLDHGAQTIRIVDQFADAPGFGIEAFRFADGTVVLRGDVTGVLPDRFEDNDSRDTATDLGVAAGTRIEQGLTAERGEADWYGFDLAAGAGAGDGLSIAFDHGAGDLDLVLVNDIGKLVGSSAGTGDQETISFNGLAPGRYFAAVSGFAGAENPDYTLTLTAPDGAAPMSAYRIEAVDAERAEGDSGTTPLTFRVTREGGLTTAGAVDYQAFPTAGITVDTDDFATGGTFPSGQVTFAAGQVSADLSIPISGDTVLEGDETFEILLSNPQNGTIAGTGRAQGRILNDDPVPVAADRFEPNDTLDTATDFGVVTGMRIETNLTITTGNDDYFRFTSQGPGQSTDEIEITFDHDLGDLDLQLLRSDGSSIAVSNGVTDREVISLAGLEAGTYIARVYGFSGAENPNYTLAIDTPQESAAVVIGAQDFNDLTPNSVNTDRLFNNGRLTNPGSNNDGGPGLDFFVQWTNFGNFGPAVGGADTQDAIGVNWFNGGNAPDVSPSGVPTNPDTEKNFSLNDSDGTADLRFEPLDLRGFAARSLSFSYWIGPEGTYDGAGETADKLEVYLGTPTTPIDAKIFEIIGNDLNAERSADNGTDTWVDVTIDLEPFLARDDVREDIVQVMIATRTDEDLESIFIDDVAVKGVPVSAASIPQGSLALPATTEVTQQGFDRPGGTFAFGPGSRPDAVMGDEAFAWTATVPQETERRLRDFEEAMADRLSAPTAPLWNDGMDGIDSLY